MISSKVNLGNTWGNTMDSNSYQLLKDYKEEYYPIRSPDILETLMERFIEDLPYTSPIYILNMCDIFYETMYKGPVDFCVQPKKSS